MRRLFLSLAVLALGVNASVQAADDVKDPTGTWQWEYDYGQGPIDNTLVVKNTDGKITGYYDNGTAKVDIAKGEFKDDKFTAAMTLELDGQELKVELEGEVTNDDLEGLITVDVGGEILEFDWEAKRGLVNADVVGTWELEINSPDGQVFTPTVIITEKDDKLTAKYDADDAGEFDVDRVEIKDGALEFDVTVELDGNELDLTFIGKARGETMTGDLEYDLAGTTGEAEFTGKRAEAKKEAAKE